MTTSIASKLSTWLEEPEQQATLLPLRSASSLAAMVLASLAIGLMVARWLLETELTRRAQAPSDWSTCSHCGSRLHSKGFQRRQMQTLVGAVF